MNQGIQSYSLCKYFLLPLGGRGLPVGDTEAVHRVDQDKADSDEADFDVADFDEVDPGEVDRSSPVPLLRDRKATKRCCTCLSEVANARLGKNLKKVRYFKFLSQFLFPDSFFPRSTNTHCC
jgi:hypothetical protein